MLVTCPSVPKAPNHVGPAPRVSDALLNEALSSLLKNHGVSGFNLGSYKDLERSCGADGKGLWKCRHILRALLPISPSGRFLFCQLMQSFLTVLDKQLPSEKINTTSFSNPVFASWTGRRWGVVLSHWRSVASHEINWSRAFSKLEPSQVEEMVALRSMCISQPVADVPSEPPVKKPRELKPQVSACSSCSVDASGMPKFKADLTSSEEEQQQTSVPKSDRFVEQALRQAASIVPAQRGALKLARKPASHSKGSGKNEHLLRHRRCWARSSCNWLPNLRTCS